jgi:DNA-directed RNA polymerase subunit K/omega
MSLFDATTNKDKKNIDEPANEEEEEVQDDEDEEEDGDDEDAAGKGDDEDEEDAEEDEEDAEEDEDEEDDGKGEDEEDVEEGEKKEEEEENDDDDDDDSGLEVSDYLQKFSSEKNKNYIKDFHPELASHNYEEVKLLTIITRDKNGIIIDSLHKTIPILTKFEKTRILGQRAKQIDSGARPFVNVPKDIIEGYLIAKLELAEKKIPFIIKRPIPNGGCEYWNVNDLEDL